jgi:N-methylhydantoinase A/oxoprolinase/acetone carboxylase beta subunit
VEAMAISGYLSIRNPEYEIKVKQLVEEILAVPVFCDHQLTSSLGFHERTSPVRKQRVKFQQVFDCLIAKSLML